MTGPTCSTANPRRWFSYDYIRRFVPELAKVPDRWVPGRWTAPPLELAPTGVVLEETYPYPIVEHPWARDRALAAYRTATGR